MQVQLIGRILCLLLRTLRHSECRLTAQAPPRLLQLHTRAIASDRLHRALGSMARNNRAGQFDQLANNVRCYSICPSPCGLRAMCNRTTITREMPENGPDLLVFFPVSTSRTGAEATHTRMQTTRALGSTDVIGWRSPAIRRPTMQTGRTTG